MSSNPQLGFGCASLFGLPSARSRRAVLERAYGFGIRHFDAAPIYGLGRAEPELAAFRRAHPDITVATKFGLVPSRVAKLVGLVQGPVRHALRRLESARAKVKRSARGPNAGLVGRTLYAPQDFSVASVRASLEASRRHLDMDKIDYFLMHEPADGLPGLDSSLMDFLDEQREAGRIGAWGAAGAYHPAGLASVYQRADVVQHPYDISVGDLPTLAAGQRRVVFGFLAGVMSAVHQCAFDKDPTSRVAAAQALDAVQMPDILVRDALRAVSAGDHGAAGIVLVSTTNVRHLEQLVAAAQVQDDDVLASDAAAVAALRALTGAAR